MKFINFLKGVGLLTLFITLVSFTAFGQTTYYVNNSIGLDGYDGLHSTVTGIPGQGPKLTIGNAVTAASAGDIISVEAFAAYNETLTITKKLTLQTTSATPVSVSGQLILNNNSTTTGSDLLTFSGAYSFNGGLQLIDGKIVGGNNITTTNFVQFTVGNDVSVDAQLKYTGAVAFEYLGSGAKTTGFELPAAGNTTNFASLTAAAGVNLTLNESKTILGNVSLGGTLALAGNTLTLSGAGSTHLLGGHVTNGILSLTAAAAGTVTINQTVISNLPNISISGGHANGKTVAINTTGTLGNLDVTGSNVEVVIPNVTSVGNVSNASTGTSSFGHITLGAATTVGTVLNTATGGIILSAATTISAITNSGRKVFTAAGVHSTNTGVIAINTPGAVTVNGAVELSSLVSSATQGGGEISFNAGGTVTINGNVTNNLNQTVAIATSTTTVTNTQTNGGIIAFTTNQEVKVNGNVTNNAILGGTATTTAAGQTATFFNNGQIRFAATTAKTIISGTITNSASAASLSLTGGGSEVYSGNGSILIFATAAANAYPAITNNTNFASDASQSGWIVFGGNGSAVTVASVTNSSTSAGATNGLIGFGAGSGTVTVSGLVSTTGAAGGDIEFPSSNLAFNSIVNSRTVAGADILLGAGATPGVTVNVADITNSGAANIEFKSSTDGNIILTGKLENSGSGQIKFSSLTTASISATTLNISAGVFDFAGAGAATGSIVAKIVNLTGGEIKFGTGARTFTTNGSSTVIGSTVFTNTGNTTGLLTEFVLATPSPTVPQLLTINAAGVLWPGSIRVDNNTGLAEAVTISGGNIRILGNLAFNAGFVVINGIDQRIFVGREVANPTATTGNFSNIGGYRTANNSFISINGAATATVTGAGNFGNFEVDAANGANVAGKFVSVFQLAKGAVLGGGAVVFDNSVSFPTIVRNAGTFNASPTFTSKVNVYYIGIDKTISNELPTVGDKLNDLTVATTNGTNVAGKGVVDVNVATTVNGTLTVNPNQTLLLNGVDLTVSGASVVANGDIANVTAADQLIFNRAAGTAVTGSGWLPDVFVNAGSSSNSITGPKGLVTSLLGSDNLRGGSGVNADFDPSTTETSGSIGYGAGAATLSVSFGTGAKSGSNVKDINTTNAGNVLTIATNLTQVGNIAHTAGTITVPSGSVWTYRGLAPAFTGGAASITGDGTLTFLQSAAGNAVTLNIGTAAGTIAIKNFDINLGASGDDFTVSGQPLTLSGAVTVTRGELVMGQNVTVTGNALTLTGNASVSGAGILKLNAASAPLTFSYTGSPSITNLTISNDVVLAGTGTGLSVSNAFLHEGGNLNFAARNLTITGTYTRTGGSYSATTGYLIISNGTFAKGASNFSIPNLKIALNGNVTATGAGVITVSKAFSLDVNATFTQKVSGNNTIAIGDSAVVTYINGNFDAAPTYVGKIKLVLTNSASGTIPANVWTSSVPVIDLTVNCPGLTATLPGSRLVDSNVNLLAGTLAGSTLSTGANANILVKDAALTSSLSAGANNNVTYESSAAYNTGNELPSSVNNLTIGRNGNIANGSVIVNKQVIVNGTLNISNDITMGVNGKLSAAGNVTVANGAGSNASATILTFGVSPLTFIGANQVFALGGNRTINAIELNQVGTTAKVMVSGGNLFIPGNITLSNGLFVIADGNTVTLPTTVQGFTKPVATNLSHIVGNVVKVLGLGTTGRFEFPVGTMKQYRSVAFTFLPSNPVITATNLTVSADSMNPGGSNGFPLSVEGVTVDSTAGFAWNISSSVSLGPSQTFDLEFSGNGFSTYTNVADIRVISRLGSVQNNPWVGQGGIYLNFEATPGAPVVRVTNSTGNLVSQGGKFTFGTKRTNPGYTVSGKVLYANSGTTPVSGVVVTLNPGGSSATTDAAGSYSFGNVINGSYTISAATTKAWPSSGINSTDALLVSQAFAGTATLSPIQVKAADVNLSSSVNNTDALLIVRRFAGLISAFDAGNWAFVNETVTVNNASVVKNISALATGDVNASATPANLDKKSTINLELDGTSNVNPKAESFVIPVKVSEEVSLGAISLQFTYPKDLVTFEGVSSAVSGIIANDVNGVVTIAWADLSGGKESLNLKAGSDLLNFKFKTTSNFKEKSNFAITLEQGNSELANANGAVLQGVMLKTPSITAAVPTEFSLAQNYPNPFNPSTTIQYSLKEKSSVNLTVYNILGQVVATLVDQVQEASAYKINFDASSLSSGAYFYRITVKGDSGAEFTQVNRMMLLK